MNIKTMIFSTLLVAFNLTIIAAQQGPIIRALETHALQLHKEVRREEDLDTMNKKIFDVQLHQKIICINEALSNPSITPEEKTTLQLQKEQLQKDMASYYFNVIAKKEPVLITKKTNCAAIDEILNCLKHKENSSVMADLDECYNHWSQTKNSVVWQIMRSNFKDDEKLIPYFLETVDKEVDEIVNNIKQQASE